MAGAVALVNAVIDGADGHAELRALLREHGFRWLEYDPADAVLYRTWGRTLRAFFTADDPDAAIRMLNELLLRAPLHPHLARHDGEPVHLHYAPPSAALPERFRATTLVRLAELVVEHGLSRTGVCAADGCERVYADTSRAGRRRFCSESCANRTNVAAFRARHRPADADPAADTADQDG